MSEAKHSPEPWRLNEPGGDILDANGVTCAEGWGNNWNPPLPYSAALEAANARRIVACVNACAGIPTEALEAGKLGEALAAASKMLGALNAGHQPGDRRRGRALQRTRRYREDPVTDPNLLGSVLLAIVCIACLAGALACFGGKR